MAKLLTSIILIGLILEQVLCDVASNGQNLAPTNIDPPMTNFLSKVYDAATQLSTAGPKPRSSWISLIVRSVVPLGQYIMSYGGPGAILFGQTILVLFTGFMITIGICTMTPFCIINWESFGITNPSSKNRANNVARFFTSQDALDMLTTAVSEAIEQSPHYYPRRQYRNDYNNQQNYYYPNSDNNKNSYFKK